MAAHCRPDQLVHPGVGALIREYVGSEYLQEVRNALAAAERQEASGRVGEYISAAKHGIRVLHEVNGTAKKGVEAGKTLRQIVVDEARLLSKGIDPAPLNAGAQARVAQQAQQAKNAAGAAQQASQASKVLGGIGGGIAIASGLVEIGDGIWKFASDHPEVRNAKVFHARMLSLAMHLGQKLSQPHDAQQEMWKQTLGTNLRSSHDLISRLKVYRCTEGAADAVGGGGSVAGGVVVIITAAGGPVTWAVGTTVLGAFGVYGGCKSVGCSLRDYSIRRNFWEFTEAITQIRRSAGMLGPMPRPCTLVFEGSKACQTYMIIEYCAFDGTPVTLLSCDRGDYNWYGGTFTLEPGITNLKVAFGVRGGSDVCAVDRQQAAMPWRRGEDGKCFQEVFTFGDPDGSRFSFELSGTCFHRYVSKATVWHGVGRRHEPIVGQCP